MITDSQTNKLFLADCLPTKQPTFFKRFEKVLKEIKVEIHLLPNTKDIWAVDFMPIQITKEKYVRFTYKPDYLRLKKYRHTISDVDSICSSIDLKTIKSELIVDGGNVIKTTDKVIMCDKVFKENKHIPKNELITQLKELFEVDIIFFVPWDKDDFTGHADGMVRFIDSDTIFINDYSKEKESFKKSFKKAIRETKLNWVELPYNPPYDPTFISAKGNYMNYLQMNQAIIIPEYKSNVDEKAMNIFEETFKGQTIISINSNEIAKEGGVLNCITWNILK